WPRAVVDGAVVLVLFAILLTCLVLGSIDLAVDHAGLHQFFVVADRADAAAVHHDDAVGILHGSDALRNDDLGGLRDELTEPLADQGVGLGVHRAGGVVQDQHFGLFQQRAGNAQALLLAAGYVGAALLDPGVVLVGELLDEFVGLRQLAGLHHLSVGGVR